MSKAKKKKYLLSAVPLFVGLVASVIFSATLQGSFGLEQTSPNVGKADPQAINAQKGGGGLIVAFDASGGTAQAARTDAAYIVKAGGGGPLTVATGFFPQKITIRVGEKITWVNPTVVGEPHTVSFMADKRYFADFGSPFVIPNNTQFSPAISGSNADPLLMLGQNGTNILTAVNKRSIVPTVIDAKGNSRYLEPNATYTINGTEKYVNSGWIWPQKQIPPGFPPISAFTVRFEKAGTYDYLCLVHPWMLGQVIVK